MTDWFIHMGVFVGAWIVAKIVGHIAMFIAAPQWDEVKQTKWDLGLLIVPLSFALTFTLIWYYSGGIA